MDGSGFVAFQAKARNKGKHEYRNKE